LAVYYFGEKAREREREREKETMKKSKIENE